MTRPERIHQALCSCGYAGPPFTNRGDAERDGDEHVIAMAHGDEPEGSHRVEVESGVPR